MRVISAVKNKTQEEVDEATDNAIEKGFYKVKGLFSGKNKA